MTSGTTVVASSMGDLKARVTSLRRLAHTVWEAQLRILGPELLEFAPGQHVNLDLPSGRRVTYSIATARSGCDTLRLLVRWALPRWLPLLELELGSVVSLSRAQGEFVLSSHHRGDVVFCATGTGASPLLPMLTALAEHPTRQRRLVFWGIRGEGDLAAYEELPALCAAARAELSVHVSSPKPTWIGSRGRIVESVSGIVPGLEAPTVYLVGNLAMVAELRGRLSALAASRCVRVVTERHACAPGRPSAST